MSKTHTFTKNNLFIAQALCIYDNLEKYVCNSGIKWMYFDNFGCIFDNFGCILPVEKKVDVKMPVLDVFMTANIHSTRYF